VAKELHGEGYGDGDDGEEGLELAHQVEEVLHVQQLVPKWIGVGDRALGSSMA